MPSRSTRISAGRPALRPSTQTFLVGAVAEGIAVVMLLIAVFVSVGSPSAVIATFIICSVVGIIASSLATILALVGLIRYRSRWAWNLLLLVCSIIFNPFLWWMFLALA